MVVVRPTNTTYGELMDIIVKIQPTSKFIREWVIETRLVTLLRLVIVT